MFIHMNKYFFDTHIEVYCIVGILCWCKISRKCLQTLQKIFLQFCLSWWTWQLEDAVKRRSKLMLQWQSLPFCVERCLQNCLDCWCGWETGLSKKRFSPGNIDFNILEVSVVSGDILILSYCPSPPTQLLLLKPVVIGLTYKWCIVCVLSELSQILDVWWPLKIQQYHHPFCRMRMSRFVFLTLGTHAQQGLR